MTEIKKLTASEQRDAEMYKAFRRSNSLTYSSTPKPEKPQNTIQRLFNRVRSLTDHFSKP